jgi:alkanesulfonate monooxygenase SsuD/methylene tetrahydromethanopterin reductase-like flavin-dependent oxidoreductase (luciferase family)
MTYKLSIGFRSRGGTDTEDAFNRVRAADEAGVDTIWAAESWGGDAFTLMGQIVERTKNVKVGSAIVNVYSRTPAALAQHFASLDVASGGRMIIGLGTSGANVIEHFHGIPFEKPIQRTREYVEIINILIAGAPLKYQGEIFQMNRGFTLNMTRERDHIPVYLATLSPKSVKQTAEIADGWIPIWTPIDDIQTITNDIAEAATAAGRPADSVTLRSPGGVIITKDVDRARAATAGNFAFYMNRMGVYYHRHIRRLGDVVDIVQKAWEEGGSGAGAEAVPPDFQQQLVLVTNSLEEARERIAQEEAAGIDLHSVSIEGQTAQEMQKTYEALMR